MAVKNVTMLPAPKEASMKEGSQIADRFRKWVDSELDKIFLSARLLGVGLVYWPSREGRIEGLQDRGGFTDDFNSVIVHHIPMMGDFYFDCPAKVVVSQIRIPGLNAEYVKFTEKPRQSEILDVNGQSVLISLPGPVEITVHRDTDFFHR